MVSASSLEELFGLLEVSPNASKEVLGAAYKALLLKYHPDRNNGDDRLFKKVSEAYSILSDPDEMSRYKADRQRLQGKIVGGYRIISLIAEGGFGKTYKAEYVRNGALACIKHCHELDSFGEEILNEEALAMWDLRHYSVPAVRGLLPMPDGKLALVMSYIPGPTLTEIVEKLYENGQRLDPVHVAWITERSLNALRYLHQNGVIHGDYKPHNIIVEPHKHMASIVDFGLSKIKPKKGSGSKGYTDYFSAPEIVNEGTSIPESDLYSVGMTMIWSLSGDLNALASKRVPRDTPEPMRKFINRLIVRDPLSRPRWPRDRSEPDLYDEFLTMRVEAFGSGHSSMKPIPFFENS